uniref:Putative rho-and arf-gtpase activating protein arap3 n=3 Tax=Anopheles triannulatus TaxID=58253 RepID=A0A2M4A1G9_9DIPT
MTDKEAATAEKQDVSVSPVVPVPRTRPSRQTVPAVRLEPESQLADGHYVNTRIVPQERPIPAPRTTRSRVLLAAGGTEEGQQQGGEGDGRYQNVVIIRRIQEQPEGGREVAAPVAPTGTGGEQRMADHLQPTGTPVGSGSGRLAGKLCNNLHGEHGLGHALDSDGVSVGSGDSGGGGSGGGTRGSTGSGKYKTNSPGELFKTIGATSRLLTESIGERVAHKTRKVANNVRHTGTSLVSWSQSVGRGGRSSKAARGVTDEGGEEPAADQSGSGTIPETLQGIQFHSPLLNNQSPGAGNPIEPGSSGDTATYDVPRCRGAKLTNLLHERSPSSSCTPPSSVHESSLSLDAPSSVGSGTDRPAPRFSYFQRTAPASQSLYSRVLPKRSRQLLVAGTGGADQSPIPAPGVLGRQRQNKSESNLYESTFYVDCAATTGSEPEPQHLYGKLNVLPKTGLSSSSSSSSSSSCSLNASEDDNTLPELRKPTTSAVARRVRQIFSRQTSLAGDLPATDDPSSSNHRSDSWNFYDITMDGAGGGGDSGSNSSSSSSSSSPLYGHVSEMQSSLLMPVSVAATATTSSSYMERHDYDEVSIADIIDEFDPLTVAGGDDGEAGGLGTIGELSLIEELLSAESYANRPAPSRRVRLAVANDGEDCRLPKPPKRSDSLLDSGTAAAAAASATTDTHAPTKSVPAKPKRTKQHRSSVAGRPVSEEPPRPVPHQIVHQNLNLPSDSVENLVDEHVIRPYLAILDEGEGQREGEGGDGAAGQAEPPAADLSYPRRMQAQALPQTSWYVGETGCFEKLSNVNPVNVREAAGGPGSAVEKASKQSLPPELSSTGTEQLAPVPTGGRPPTELPSYFEAIGGTDPVFEHGLAAAPGSQPAKPAPPLPPPPSAAKPATTSVASKLLNVLKRRPSLNRGSTAATSATGKSEVRTVLEMVPKPRLTERLITYKGHVLKFPSGKISDVLNELSPRSIVLRERIFQTFLDTQQTIPKESLQLRYILALQCILQHKFTGEGRLELHCFEIVLALPKSGGGGGGASGGEGGAAGSAAIAMSTNPDLLITSGATGNVKSSRASYMFGTHKRSDRNLWMAKILLSVTDVFPEELLREFLRAGWCYAKKSVTAEWAGAWLLLAKRRLHLFSYADSKLEQLDLRKARCITMIESETGTIGNLHVETGPTLLIDCPPYATLYFIMSSPRETQIWRKMIRQGAHRNGPTLHGQQLTQGDVPVLIDKCVNFIYAHGSMSEGIYRKSGSMTAVGRILQLFAEDAFDVQLTRAEYSEYDVAGALKKFIRELPGSFFGSYAASFVAIGRLTDVQVKVESYRQLLQRLPRIEYCTLKKLLSHLAFIASLEAQNRMGVPNLAMIWGTTLLANASQNTVDETQSYHQGDAQVVADLIQLYRRLFPVTEDELRKDQLMLTVLQKYHAAADNLSDAVKHSGDLKVWITIDCDTPLEQETADVEKVGLEDKPQINVDVTPTKTASDVCKELAGKTKHPWYKLTLYEVVLNGSLVRPIHYRENVLEVVVRWTYWEQADRKNNYLTLKPTTTLNDVYRTIQKAPVLTPTMELRFADRRTKGLRNYQLQLVGKGLVVLKKIEKKDRGFEELLKIDLTRVLAYIGCEPKRDRSSLRWAITLVDVEFKSRSRDEPFIGHIFGGLDFASQMLWYASILYSHHKDDILPSGDLFF